METPVQVKDRERLKRYIHREQLASVMSQSKWRRLVVVLEEFSISCTFRRQDVTRSNPGAYWMGWRLLSRFRRVMGVNRMDRNQR